MAVFVGYTSDVLVLTQFCVGCPRTAAVWGYAPLAEQGLQNPDPAACINMFSVTQM